MGEIVRYKRDVWGEEVILGVSWDLLWVVAVAVLVLLVAAHAIIMAALANKKMDKPSAEGRRVSRHDANRSGIPLGHGAGDFRPDHYRRGTHSWAGASPGSSIHWISGCNT